MSDSDTKKRRKAKAPKIGECCAPMDLVTMRGVDSRLGVSCEQGFNFATGEQYPAVITRFRKAKRSEDGVFGHGTEFADKTFAMFNFCPFCGAKLVRA